MLYSVGADCTENLCRGRGLYFLFSTMTKEVGSERAV
jgi:hypothetical protein